MLGPKQTQWVKALRSRKYLQGRGRLKEGVLNPKYCCFGVANQLAVNKTYSHFYLDGHTIQEFGLKNCDGEFIYNGKKTSLAQLNDRGCSFEKIADIIEENAEQLFTGPV